MEIVYEKLNEVPTKLYRAENAAGTVLAVHGFGGSKESAAIEGLAKRVCKNGLNVLTFDLPAHGERTEPASELRAERCLKELLMAEQYAQSLGGSMYAFATSFGGMCMLQRLEKMSDSYKKVVLRVPAVDMAQSLVRITALTDRAFSMEKAKQDGFKITLGREYIIPYRFYEELLQMDCLRSCTRWNNDSVLTIHAEQDELVSPAATAEFLRLNPEMRRHCVKSSGHRMQKDGQLDEALDTAVQFLLL